jgi:hypothetical protein
MLEQDKLLAAQFEDMNQFKITIIEEKRKDHTGSKLEKWEPQVIGEGLAMWVKSRLILSMFTIQIDFDSIQKTGYFFFLTFRRWI